MNDVRVMVAPATTRTSHNVSDDRGRPWKEQIQ